MAEDDRVGDLHHRSLHVQRKEHVLRCGVFDLFREEGDESFLAHAGSVDDFIGEERNGFFQYGLRSVRSSMNDVDARRVGDSDRLLIVPEVAGAHRRDVGLGVVGPLAHAMGILSGVFLDCVRCAAIGIAFTKHRIYSGALDRVIGRLDLALIVVRRLIGIVGEGVALGLELSDRVLHLGDGSGHVRQLDDVGFGCLHEAAKFRETVRLALFRLESIGEDGQ